MRDAKRDSGGTNPSGERFEIWRTANAPGIELMDVTSSDRCWRVVHDGFCVAICRAGATDYRYRGRAFVKSAGVVTVHEPGEAYAAHRQYGLGAASVFSIAPAVVEGWADRELVGRGHFVPEPAAEPVLARRLLLLARALRAGLPPAEIEECVGEALVPLFAGRAERARRGRRTRRHRLVARVKERLHDTLHEKISLGELAADVGWHKLYLLSVFRDEVGVPPHAYWLQLRVARARTMLAGGAPIAEVVAKLGFSDQSHLNRHFRRAFGVAPGAYARLLRSAGQPSLLK